LTSEKRLFIDKFETTFLLIFVFYIIVLTINIMVHVASIYTAPSLKEDLASSLKTPWGIVTSLFVHSDTPHLINNMVVLFIFLLLLLSLNLLYSKNELKSQIMNSIITIFSIPILLNAFWAICHPEIKVYGSSGIVYALQGVCFGFSFLNSLKIRKIRWISRVEKRHLLLIFLFNIIVFTIFIIGFIVSPIEILGDKDEATVWLHGFSFFFGFITVIMLFMLHILNYIYKIRNFTYKIIKF